MPRCKLRQECGPGLKQATHLELRSVWMSA
jgi:hypothetical protein